MPPWLLGRPFEPDFLAVGSGAAAHFDAAALCPKAILRALTARARLQKVALRSRLVKGNADLVQILVCKSGTLDLEGYAKHILAAHLFFFGFGLLGIALFWLVLGPMIALHAPAWLAWLPFLFGVPLLVLAIGSYFGILIASTKRFVRHLSQP
jgi:hypothetical protein